MTQIAKPLTKTSKNGWTPIKYLNVLHHLRYCKLWLFWILATLSMPSYTNLKVILSTHRKLLCLSTQNKSTSFPIIFWRYCKDMQTSYFGYFEHACLCKLKMIVPTCRTLRCLPACQKQTLPFTSLLRCYILKNLAIWLVDSILSHNSRTRILPDMGLEVNSNNNFSFHFRLIPGKTNDKIFQKIQKTLIWGHFVPFLPKFEQKWIFLE